MTNEEAIERLKCMKLFMQINDKDNESKFLGEDYEANAMAIEALEKQIPMKPQEINEERIRLDGIWDWSCGNCGRFHRNDYPLNYCNECGQKVDWSEWK